MSPPPTRRLHLLALAAVLAAAPALAAVGKVAKLEGEATRTPKGGKAVKLAVEAPIEVGDKLKVGRGGNLKLVLNDESAIYLAEGSELEITEAEFAGQERKGFLGKLKAGKLWAKVSRLFSGAKFEVETAQAVAGVRGTVFRIDAETMLKAAHGPPKKATVVRVIQGAVRVQPSKAVAQASGKKPPPSAKPKKGERVEVPAPFHEVTLEQWENRFAELQKQQQIAVGVDLWELADLDASAMSDPFSRWVEGDE